MLFEFRFRNSLVLFSALFMFAVAGLSAQTAASAESKDSSATAAPAGKQQQQVDPLKRPLTEKQRKSNEKALKQELGKEYKHWLDEDVRWIVTGEELTAFKQLSNDEERDQ